MSFQTRTRPLFASIDHHSSVRYSGFSRRRSCHFVATTPARKRSSDSTSAGSATVSAISCQGRIRRIGLPGKEHFQALEMLQPAVLREFARQILHDSIEQGKHPAALEDPFGRLTVRGLALVALSSLRCCFEW